MHASVTILPHDLPSFVTTDHQQSWLSQPQSSRPPLPTPPSPSTFGDHHDTDFVLFPATEVDSRPVPRRHANTVPSPATSHITRSPAHPAAFTSPQSTTSLNGSDPRLHSPHSVSPIQNPRVSGLIHGTGSTASSPSQGFHHGLPSTVPAHRYYAASAPSSSTDLHLQQHLQQLQSRSPRGRPPVPLFSQSTGNIPQATSSVSNTFVQTPIEGSSPSSGPPSPFSLTVTDSDMSTDFDFDFTASAAEASANMFDDYTTMTAFETVNGDHASGSSIQTVSPKDIMVDSMSAPPSTTLTDLTTPGTSYEQSPWIAGTSEMSPLFSESDLDADAAEWPSLFGTEHAEDFTVKNRSASATSVPQYTVTASPVATAPKMSRTGSSPGQSSRSSHGQSAAPTTPNTGSRHSFTSGVSSRRRDKPLPAITVEDPNDTIAVKRARNTMAARKSRQKRMERTEALEAAIEGLEAEVEHWKGIALARGHVE